jgi:phosphate transport system substrate-binding protein
MRRSRLALSGLFVAALLCSSAAAGHDSAFSASPVANRKLARTTIDGEGSTFQLHYTQTVISAFKQRHPAVTVNYVGIGSARGLEDFSNDRVDFAGVDTPSTADVAAAGKGGAHLSFPLVVAPIAVVFNLPGVDDLRFSATTLAQIFQGEVTMWDAPEISAENPDATLPDLPITVARRSDRSGTTENFTTFLTRAAPSTWQLGTGSTVQWPPSTAGAAGNYGVAQIVKTTPLAIGYVDYADAHALALTMAAVQNASLAYIAPSLESAAAALADTAINPDLTFDPIDPRGPDAYPITAPTWIVVHQRQADANKAAALQAFLRFVYSSGQQLAETVDYVALPRPLVRLARARIREIVVAPS